MNSVQLFQSLFNAGSLQNSSMVPIKPGQLFYGRVEKFLPNETAIIQIGNTRLVANLQASLSTKQSYMFEVRSSSNEGIELKVVEMKGKSDSVNLLVEHFQLPETKRNKQLLQFFLEKNIPLTKEQFRIASTWISNHMDSKELNALEWMVRKDLPFTKQTFESLVAVQDSQTFSNQLVKVENYLEDPKFASLKSLQPLTQLISTMVGNHSIDKLGNGLEFKQMMQTIVQSLGLDYEKEVQLWAKDKQNSLELLDSLKPMVMVAMKELGTSAKELEPLLNRLTGMQLLSQNPTGPMQQILMQLPITFGEKLTDLTIQWSGRKTSTGQIDPDYCRILFYLDLQSLNQTVIDMQIQNRVIHVSVINDTKEIDPIVMALTPPLKEKLASIGYNLSFIKVVPTYEDIKKEPHQMKPNLFSTDLYQRVDLKI
ncbi:MAG: hypothetical protein K6T88_05405 [Bacillus sp. (in: Bacteria)]|nr:hypothetical protein [Bacillus sp. (in: firmicutes)]